MNLKGMTLLLVAGLGVPGIVPQVQALSDRTLDASGQRFSKVLEGAVAEAQKATVRVLVESESVALGTVVDSRGYLLTKASELPMDAHGLFVQMAGELPLPAERVGQDLHLDLAILKIAASNLTAITWSEEEPSALGEFLMAPTETEFPDIKVGVLAAAAREIERTGGVMGVQLDQRRLDAGVRVKGVMDDSGASHAGIQPGDIVMEVEGEAINRMRDLSNKVMAHDPGETITIKVLRNDEELVFDVLLGHRSVIFGMWNRNLLMSGPTSVRKTGYPRVIQHEISLNANEMGGPLLNMKGEAVGINIAKANRVEFYALPGKFVMESVGALLKALEVDPPENKPDGP